MKHISFHGLLRSRQSFYTEQMRFMLVFILFRGLCLSTAWLSKIQNVGPARKYYIAINFVSVLRQKQLKQFWKSKPYTSSLLNLFFQKLYSKERNDPFCQTPTLIKITTLIFCPVLYWEWEWSTDLNAYVSVNLTAMLRIPNYAIFPHIKDS